jgi:serine/threonine protein kinase
MSEAGMMRVFIQVALALAYLHERHVIHRCLGGSQI